MKIFFLALSLSLSASAYDLDRGALDNSQVDFLSHKNYLTYEIQYPPVMKLLKALKENTGPLKDRGEAHITVITPPEFDRVLGKLLTIEEVNRIALEEGIQSARYHPVCIGMGAIGDMRTYYVVVDSEELLSVRRKVRDLFVSKGGPEKAFDPEHFYPHITLGFTHDDLHEGQGVIKDRRSCLPEGSIHIRP